MSRKSPSHPEIGTCPLCDDAQVRIGPKSYYCCNAVGTRKKCTFFLPREIKSCLIPETEARQLIKTGRTGLIKGFYSKWGEPYTARLVMKDGGWEFDFPPRRVKKKQPKGGSGDMTSEIARYRASSRFRGPRTSRLKQMMDRLAEN
jgi:DNA topoisomerase III